MTDLRHSREMPNTPDIQKITRFVNASEAEAEDRTALDVLSKDEKDLPEIEKRQLDKEASDQMVDEGDPNTREKP
jgi:hypothetical protein